VTTTLEEALGWLDNTREAEERARDRYLDLHAETERIRQRVLELQGRWPST